MSNPILIVFDTKNGSTSEIAQAIASRLRERGGDVDVVQSRSMPDLADLGGLVVGAPIYSGRWLGGGHRVLKRLARLPEDRRPPVAIFALGPRQDHGPEDWARPRQQFERALSMHRSIKPVSTVLFGGADPPKKKSRRDIRDWDAIRAWADELADLFRCG